jgi:hypothetical protein
MRQDQQEDLSVPQEAEILRQEGAQGAKMPIGLQLQGRCAYGDETHAKVRQEVRQRLQVWGEVHLRYQMNHHKN